MKYGFAWLGQIIRWAKQNRQQGQLVHGSVRPNLQGIHEKGRLPPPGAQFGQTKEEQNKCSGKKGVYERRKSHAFNSVSTHEGSQ